MESSQFAALTQEEQISRIELLARAALREFGVEPLSIAPLVHAENTTFRIESDKGRFCLRVCRPGYQSDANVASEIAFVGVLRDAGFDVPRPYRNQVVKAAVAEVPEARNCVLLGWQEGSFADGRLSPEQAARVGEAMARMHAFSQSWTPPAGFERQSLHPWLDRPMAIEAPHALIAAEDIDLLSTIAQESRDLLHSLPRDATRYGLIHGDLHRGNVLFADDGVRIIDFDDTGWAYWMADFAAALAYECSSDNYAEVERAMLEGYGRVRPLPPETERLLPSFIRMRIMTVSEWIAQRSDNPHTRETGGAWVGKMCEIARKIG